MKRLVSHSMMSGARFPLRLSSYEREAPGAGLSFVNGVEGSRESECFRCPTVQLFRIKQSHYRLIQGASDAL
ncbi:hypothetical protein [Methylobacterium sp. J-092]|uniref:hypothetical protein n=1 Tax=Methylobacterium sp. J-092 TaxID=2836667 RepID=UPI001FBA9961|nr:hypothetical protein [Methylobacterium sp. J-092]MCJ2009164.1 hypothetical protein [Methylobacterium sp. J-092]